MGLLGVLGKGVLVFDGAMGTALQSMGLPPGLCPEAWCLEKPAMVAEVHRRYVEAGARAVETNTFGATPARLAHYGLEGKVREINVAAVRIAREAVQGRALVAGSMGPLGVLVEPLGDLSFDRAYEAFSAQARALAEARPDFIIIETVADLNEMRAAILACKDNAPGIRIIAQMTLDANGRSFTGTGPETAGLVMQSMGADVVGFNCSVGPDLLVDPVARLARVARVPVSVQPNAGLPRLTSDGRTEFPMGPEEFASYGPKLVAAGASIVGGCCGTTPEHIRLLSGAVAGLKPLAASTLSPGRLAGLERALPGFTAKLVAGLGPGALGCEFALTSRTYPVFAVEEDLPIIIGERINPTGRKALSRDIKEGAFIQVRQEARAQAAAGARVLDVNVGVPLIDEAQAMAKAVRAVQEAVPLPVSLDSASLPALEAGLKAFVGKALINSFSLEEGKADRILPLASRYGAAVLGLTIDERGIPATAEERLDIARRLVEKAVSYGIPAWDVVIDPLALTAGAQQDQAVETLKAIRIIRSELGCRTSLGVSNVSYGLPNRPFLNAVFLNMALASGLDMAIINPTDERMMDTVRAARVFLNRDRSAKEYISAVAASLPSAPSRLQLGGAGASAGSAAAQQEAQGPGRKAYDAVLQGDKEAIVPLVEQALSDGTPAAEILNGYLIPAINEVGRLFGAGVYFLPQLMLSAAAMKAAFEFLKPEMARARAAGEESATQDEGAGQRGVVVMATVQGDIHDIGKNIVAVLLENHGFKVIDLGRDVKPETILEEARRAGADMVCLSALMTTTMPGMKDVIDLFAREDFDCPVLIGGAATTRSFADQIGAKGYGRDAQEAVSEALRIIGERRRKV
jgi:5-methyltetrahydrofolate--homocysteine methyltransferase